MKSFKLVVTGAAILMCILLVSIFKTADSEDPRQHKINMRQPTLKTEIGDADVLVHAISYQLNQLYF